MKVSDEKIKKFIAKIGYMYIRNDPYWTMIQCVHDWAEQNNRIADAMAKELAPQILGEQAG